MLLDLKTSRILFVLLALICFGRPVFPEEGFSVFVPTDYRNPLSARYDALRLEFPDIETADLGQTVKRANQTSVKKVVVYISQDRTKEELHTIMKDVVEPFPDQRIEVRVFGKDGHPDLEGVISHVKEKHPGVQIKIKTPVDPEKIGKMIEKMAITKGVLGAGQRMGQLSYTGVNVSPEGLTSAAALVTADALLNYFGTKYETEIGRAFSGHKIPFLSRFGFKGLQNFYSNNKLARFIKGTASNLLLWGVGANATFQTMAHGANCLKAQLPNEIDLGRWLSTSAIGSVVYFSSFTGLEKLRQRGWINQPTMDLYLRGNNLLYQLATVPNSSGNAELLAWFHVIIGAHWGVHLIPATLGNLLPIKNDRLVIMDNLIKDRATIDGLEGLEATAKVETGEAGRVYHLESKDESLYLSEGQLRKLKQANRTPIRNLVAGLRSLCSLNFAKVSRK